MGIVLIALVLQILTALAVIFVLSRNLNKELIKFALEQFEVLKIKEDLALIKEIVVVSSGVLDDAVTARMKTIASQRFKGVVLNFSSNPALRGGMIIIVGEEVIDCSAKTRLNNLWSAK